MRAFLAGFRLEVRMVRANPDSLIPLFTAPFFTIIFLTIVRNHGRHDLHLVDGQVLGAAILDHEMAGRIDGLT